MESRFLLELDFVALEGNTLETQSYWLLAMKSARLAGQCQKQRHVLTAQVRDRPRRLAARPPYGSLFSQIVSGPPGSMALASATSLSRH